MPFLRETNAAFRFDSCLESFATMDVENRELAEIAYKSRKRVSGVKNIEQYKHNKIKKAKIAGEPHKNHKGRDVAPRQTGADCRSVHNICIRQFIIFFINLQM